MFYRGREFQLLRLKEFSKEGTSGVMLLGAAPAGLLQTHCPQHHSPEKTQIPPPKQEETGTKSTRDGKLREDSPFFFFFYFNFQSYFAFWRRAGKSFP